jgi:hypothetical protein
MTRDSKAIGLLCLDSEHRTLFDDQHVQQLLEQVSSRIAAVVLLLYDGSTLAED